MKAGGRRPQWTFIAVLAIACTALAILQFHWIGQITSAERDRARAELTDRLQSVSADLNDEIRQALAREDPDPRPGPAFSQAPACLFHGSEFVERGGDLANWFRLDSQGRPVPAAPPGGSTGGYFFESPPPGELGYVRGFVIRDVRGGRGPDPDRPGGPPDHRPPPHIIQVAALDIQCLDDRAIPQLIERYFGRRDPADYDIRVIDEAGPAAIYQSSASASGLTPGNADASVPLLGPPHSGRGPGAAPGRFGRAPRGAFLPPPPGAGAGGGLLLLARHKSGSLDAMVARERNRYLAVSGAMLLLIVAAGIALIRFARAANRVSQLRMNIVAGVSHELRSPLAVIRTAAFNLQRVGFPARPDQVRRYGELIGAESSRLERLIDNVLQFAAGSAAQNSKERISTGLDELIECELQFLEHVIAAAGMSVDCDIAAHLPGVAAAECEHVFEPFFRGARPIGDQVHGAGLGLSLAAQIVRAHGGSISVDEAYRNGAAFIIRLPALARSGEPDAGATA